jgi:hypothetical protein
VSSAYLNISPSKSSDGITGGRKVRLCLFKIPCHHPIYRIVSSRFHHDDENYVDFKFFFVNIMPTTSCNSNIVFQGLTIVAWAHTRTIDFDK